MVSSKSKFMLVASAVALSAAAIAAPARAGSVVNMFTNTKPVTNSLNDQSREGFFTAAGVPITDGTAIVPGDVIRGYFHVDQVNSSQPDAQQGVEMTAVFSLAITAPSGTGTAADPVRINFAPDPNFSTAFGGSFGTNAVVAFFQDSSLNSEVAGGVGFANPSLFNDGQYLFSIGLNGGPDIAYSYPLTAITGNAGSTNNQNSQLSSTYFAFSLTGQNVAVPGLSSILSRLVTNTVTDTTPTTHVNLTDQFVGHSSLFGSADVQPNTINPSYAVIDHTDLTFTVAPLPLPAALPTGLTMLGALAAVGLVRRRKVAVA